MVNRDFSRRAGVGLAVILVATAAAASPAAADVGAPIPDGPYCSRTSYPHAQVSCTVTEPVVTQAATTYPIVVHRGDWIKIEASGCVQTGGHGLTWKRYVDPQSGNDLYHGLVDIPGVTNGLQRIQGVQKTWFRVFGEGNVILGYEDDGYPDNGYYAHDDGTNNQCKNTGPAEVRININRAA